MSLLDGSVGWLAIHRVLWRPEHPLYEHRHLIVEILMRAKYRYRDGLEPGQARVGVRDLEKAGLGSTSTVSRRLRELEESGFIDWDRGLGKRRRSVVTVRDWERIAHPWRWDGCGTDSGTDGGTDGEPENRQRSQALSGDVRNGVGRIVGSVWDTEERKAEGCATGGVDGPGDVGDGGARKPSPEEIGELGERVRRHDGELRPTNEILPLLDGLSKNARRAVLSDRPLTDGEGAKP